MANVGPTGIVRYEEKLAVDNISTAAADGIGWLTSADAADTAFARAVAAGKGLHLAGALAATDNNMIELCGDSLMFAGQEGHCAVELLIAFDVITDLAFNFGFNDAVLETSNTLPCELAAKTWVTNASTFAGLVFDVDATDDELHVMWVDDDSDSVEAIANLRMKGIAPTAGKWLFMRVSLQDRGSGKGLRATFLVVDHNGRSVEKTFNTTVDRDCPLCWYLGVENRAATAHNVYIKGIAWEQAVADL